MVVVSRGCAPRSGVQIPAGRRPGARRPARAPAGATHDRRHGASGRGRPGRVGSRTCV